MVDQELVQKTSFPYMMTQLGASLWTMALVGRPNARNCLWPQWAPLRLCFKRKYKYTSWLYSHVLWIAKWLVQQPFWPSVCLLTALGRAEHFMNFSESWYIKSTPREFSSNDWELSRPKPLCKPLKTPLKSWEFVFFLLSFLLLIFLLSSG